MKSAQGKALFEEKAFCKARHGVDGKGLGEGIEPASLKGLPPGNATDKCWQTAHTDGAWYWILKNGSSGTDIASCIPLVLTEDEAWHVLLYMRSIGQP